MSTFTLQKSQTNSRAVLDVINERWSPRAFADKPIEPEKLQRLLEAARWAPSSYNEQPWRFLVATKNNPDEHERLLQCLKETNQAWAKSAPVLMLTVTKKHFDHNEKRNQHAWHDVGLAMGNLLAQATALDLYAHQMAGIRPDKARETYGIPETYEAVAGVALGRLADDVDEQEKMSGRSRRPLDETVFTGMWGATADVVAGENRER